MMIENWRAIALKSHSMWAQYLGLLTLTTPELLFIFLQYDAASPRLWFFAGLLLLVYGIVGRLKDQGLSK